MNRANVWTLSDLGDAAALSKAIKNVPTCVNVCGWSYAGGKRRGVSKDADGKWSIVAGEGNAATILHYATIRNSLSCIVLALENGASADTTVLGATADVIAEEMGHKELVEVIQVARRKEMNKLGVCEEDEVKGRKLLELHELSERQKMIVHLEEGVVDVEVLLRDVGETSKHHLSVPRYIKFTTFQKKVEELVGQRVLLSYVVPKQPAAGTGHETSLVVHEGSGGGGASPNKSNTSTQGGDNNSALISVSDMEARAKWEAENEGKSKPRYMELKQKTIAIFLSHGKPQCIARPLTFCYASVFGSPAAANTAIQGGNDTSAQSGPSPSPSPSHHHNNASALSRITDTSSKLRKTPLTNLSEKINAVALDTSADHDKKIELMKRLINEEDKPEVFGKKINGEQKEQCIQRLYNRPLQKIMSKKQDYDDFCDVALSKFKSPSRNRGMSPAAEEFVQRLFDAAQKREDKVAEIEQRVQDNLPKPKVNALPPDEIDAASNRLWKMGKQGLKDSDKRIYGESQRKVVSDMAAHLDSIYNSAVQKKKDAIEKLSKSYGDFRSKKTQKKMTMDEIKAMGDRLCKK